MLTDLQTKVITATVQCYQATMAELPEHETRPEVFAAALNRNLVETFGEGLSYPNVRDLILETLNELSSLEYERLTGTSLN